MNSAGIPLEFSANFQEFTRIRWNSLEFACKWWNTLI